MTTNSKKNKVSANEVKTAANAIILQFTENTKGVLKTSLGTKKSSLYKEELFSECTEKEKKSLRKKFRNMLFSAAKSLQTEKGENQKKLIKSFNELYFAAYKTNDYTLQSVCNENLSKEKKEILTKALAICKG